MCMYEENTERIRQRSLRFERDLAHKQEEQSEKN